MKSLEDRVYIAIDLKSFYASVECIDRGLDPLTTNLVVADVSRTEKTICLAVSPSLKSYGISGRARLFEVVQRVKEVNHLRLASLPDHRFTGKSCDAAALSDPTLEVDYIAAPPQMARYMKRSTEIYQIYLKYIAPEDIHVYSIDEVFIDATSYLKTYQLTARELALKIIQDVLHSTGITATAGIGSNLYLCKIAMDIQAKHIAPDRDGVRIAHLTEESYRRLLWTHEPLTDFWRVGKGYARKLQNLGLTCMGDIAAFSVSPGGEDVLYRLFGVNAELLIDHAWGYEPCTIADIKAYRPENSSINSGQVLQCPYPYDKARLVLREMADDLSLSLVKQKLLTDQIVLTVGYDIDNLKDPEIQSQYHGEIVTDSFGRRMPKHAHGTKNLKEQTSSTTTITDNAVDLFDRIVNPLLLIRRMYIVANHLIPESEKKAPEAVQMDLFTDYHLTTEDEDIASSNKTPHPEKAEKERKRQEAILKLQKKYGKNVVLKGISLTDGATAQMRNGQIGGHKA